MNLKKSSIAIYFYLRLLFIWLLKICVKPRMREEGQPKKILVIRTDRLGDLVLSIPVFENLKAMYPSAQVTVLVRPGLQECAALIPSLDQVMEYEGFFQTWGALRRAGFDTVFDLIADWRLSSAVLAYLTGAHTRAGFCGGFREMLLTHAVDPDKTPALHLVELNQLLVRSVGIRTPVLEPHLAHPARVKIESGFTIGIHPGGYYASQRWLPERFAELAKRLSDAYACRCVAIGGPQDKEIVTRILSVNKEATMLFPSLTDLPGVLASCDILICNNSGPLHLACALDVPTVSTMGPTDPVRWWPRSSRAVVVRSRLGCMPCQRGFCLRHECMEAISVEEMFQAVAALAEKIYGIKPHS